MEVLAIILIIYGILCFLIALLRPPFIMNSKKFEILNKYLGKIGTTLLLVGFGAAAIIVGVIIYP